MGSQFTKTKSKSRLKLAFFMPKVSTTLSSLPTVFNSLPRNLILAPLMVRLLLLILSLSLVLDVSVADAARRRSRGRTAKARRAPAKPKATPEQLAKAARTRDLVDFARKKTDEAFAACSNIGTKFGKNELDADYQTRRCLLRILLGLETRIVESRKLTGDELAAHVLLMTNLDAIHKMNTVESLNDFDRLNLYQAILVAKKTQLGL